MTRMDTGCRVGRRSFGSLGSGFLQVVVRISMQLSQVPLERPVQSRPGFLAAANPEMQMHPGSLEHRPKVSGCAVSSESSVRV